MLSELIFFFFNDTATTEIYTLSLHDALPIYILGVAVGVAVDVGPVVVHGGVHGQLVGEGDLGPAPAPCQRSEEHTSELQSRQYLVCRLLLEKKKKNTTK